MASSAAHLDPKKGGVAVCEAFGAYGWSGEAPKMMAEELKAMKVDVVGEPLKVAFAPKADDLAKARALGAEVGRALEEKIKNFQ